jgi:hypothetical protein
MNHLFHHLRFKLIDDLKYILVFKKKDDQGRATQFHAPKVINLVHRFCWEIQHGGFQTDWPTLAN